MACRTPSRSSTASGSRRSKDYDDWLARLDGFPGLHGPEHRAHAREHEDQRAPAEDHRRARARSGGGSSSTQPADKSGYLPSVSNDPRRRSLRPIAIGSRRPALEHVRTHVQPSFARLLDFIDREYLPASYERVGWWQTSGGDKRVPLLRRLHTTTNLSPAGHSRARASRGRAHPRAKWKHPEAGRFRRHAR